MTAKIRRLVRLFSCLLMLGMAAYAADPAKTVVSDTIYRADGTPASGTMMITWPAFVAADGKPVAAGSKTVKIGADGAVNLALVPTQGATPAGTYYKVVLSLDDGSSSQEYWTVPTLSPTTIAAIRSSVVPATVAMQVVSREYVDGAVANSVHKTGDESIAGTKSFSSSPLVPSPTEPAAAANKDYVDVSVTAAAAGAGSGTLALNKGGTGQTSWTPARCVRVANNGSYLESAPADCGGGSGNATQIQGKAVDMPDAARQLEVYDGVTAFKKWQDPVVRMNRDCGIVGSGDETAALNSCIANLPSYTGILQCDKPGMVISTTGVTVRDKVSIRIETAPAGHTLANYCQIVYTGTTGGTVIDVERTRDSVLFKGFAVYMGNADIGIQTGQTGSGTNIATADSFEDLTVINNAGRSTAIGFMIGDVTTNNNDEMHFSNVTFTSQLCTKCGTAFKDVNSNVYGTKFVDIKLIEVGIGWDWIGNMSADKVNGYDVGLLYKLQGNGLTYDISHEDFENVDQILSYTNGDGTFYEHDGRVMLATTLSGWGVTGTVGHPVWASGAHLIIRTMHVGCCGTYLDGSGGPASYADVDFYDLGLSTFGSVKSSPPYNALNFYLPNWLYSTKWGDIGRPWVGGGFIDEKGMMVPGVGMQAYQNGTNLRMNVTPCARGNICFNEGQVELTGVHSIFNTPTISYTGTAGSTARYYAVVACDDTACAPGHRSIPSNAVGKTNTQATLDGSNYITLSWTPALGANKYGILQEQAAGSDNWNLLMSNVSCSTNPCTVNVTTDSGSYVSGYPSDNETGGVLLRGAVKFGKSATQPAALDLTYATVTPPASMIPGLNADLLDGKHASDFLAATTQLPLTKTAVSHKWLASFDATTGAYGQTQPDYSDLTGTPTLATVATSGAYADLTGKPALAANTSATSHQFFSAYNSTTGAFTKAQPDYSDLTGIPVLPASKTCTGSDKVSAYDASTGGFTCSADQTGAGGSGITSLNGATVSSQTLVDGANIHVSTNTGTGAHTIAVTGLGGAAALNVGTTTGTVAAGDDSRMSNARTPTAHAASHQNGGSDEIATATAAANAIPKAGSGGTLAAAWIPTLNQNTTGTAAGITGKTFLGTATKIAQTSASAPASNKCVEFDTNGNLVIAGSNAACGSGGSMTWPSAAGIAVYSGSSSWGTSLTAPSGAIVGTSDSQALTNKDMSGAGNTWPTFNQNTTGTAAGLTAQYIDWSAGSGGNSIANKPTLPANEAGASNNFLTAYNSSTGAFSKARPTWANVDKTTSSVADIATRTCSTLSDSAGGCSMSTTAGGDLSGTLPSPTVAKINGATVPTIAAATGLMYDTSGTLSIAGTLPTAAMPALTGDITNSAGSLATTLRTGLNVKRCEIHIWGTGTSSVLQDTDDEVASCLNKYGVTWTITYVGCWANAGSPTVMITKTGGNNVLTGNLTCGTASWASGTLTGTTADKQTADGGTVDINVASAGGTATNIRVVIAGTI